MSGHPLHLPDSKVGFAVPWLRKKCSFAVLVRDIRTSVVVAMVVVAMAAVTAEVAVMVVQRGYPGVRRVAGRGSEG